MATFTGRQVAVISIFFLVLGGFLGALAHDRIEGAKMAATSARMEGTIVQALAKMEELKKYPPIEAGVQAHGRQEIAYADKVIDPATGKQETTDVEINNQEPKVSVKVDGQTTAFSLRKGETQKFQNGKLVVDQAWDIGVAFDISGAAEALAKERGYYRDQFWQTELAKRDRWVKYNMIGFWHTNKGKELEYNRRLTPELGVGVKADIDGDAEDRRYGLGLQYHF